MRVEQHTTTLRNIPGYVDRISDRNRRARIIALANSKSTKQSPIMQTLNGMVIIHPSSSRKKKASVQEKEDRQSMGNLSARVEIRHGYESF
jgi:hypothetical protein